jgi:hypothetical protein
LLLGLKGTMSEAELHVLKSRLQQGILNKARRGELKLPLPAGLAYDELDRVVLTPDTQVRAAIERFFATFRRLGAAFAVVREFGRDHVLMPHCSRTGPKSGRIIWGGLTSCQAQRILHNPRYAGAFAYGRTQLRRGPDGQSRFRKLPQDEWTVLIPDLHEGYIDWDEYQANQARLAANAAAYGLEDRKTPPREGPALLQGIVLCGRCGDRMTVRYHQRRGGLVPEYVCQREKVERGGTTCQCLPGAEIDEAIGRLLVETVDAASIEAAVAVRDELRDRLDETDRLRLHQVERCRYEVDLAKHRYMQVDPGKRYVAEVLESEWNEKLRLLDQAQTEYDRATERDRLLLDENQREALYSLEQGFAEAWANPAMPSRERKRMVRLLVEDVTLLRGESVTLHVRLKGGVCRTLDLPPPKTSVELRQTSPEVVAAIDELLAAHPEHRIADILNERELTSGMGQRFTRERVGRIRIAYGLRSRRTRLEAQGKLTAGELAAKLCVGTAKIRTCREKGLLKAHEYKSGHYLYDDPGPDVLTRIPQLRPHARPNTTDATDEVQYAT